MELALLPIQLRAAAMVMFGIRQYHDGKIVMPQQEIHSRGKGFLEAKSGCP